MAEKLTNLSIEGTKLKNQTRRLIFRGRNIAGKPKKIENSYQKNPKVTKFWPDPTGYIYIYIYNFLLSKVFFWHCFEDNSKSLLCLLVANMALSWLQSPPENPLPGEGTQVRFFSLFSSCPKNPSVPTGPRRMEACLYICHSACRWQV